MSLKVAQQTPTVTPWTVVGAGTSSFKLSLTASSKVNESLLIPCDGLASVIISTTKTGTVSSGVLTLEASDDYAATWVTAVGLQLIGTGNQTQISTISFTTNTVVLIPVAGYTHIRARLTTIQGGVGSTLVKGRASFSPFNYVTNQMNGIQELMTTTGNPGNDGQGASAMVGANGSPFNLSVANFLIAGAAAAAGGNWQAQRTPAVFKSAQVLASASGNSAVWTPTAGKKFRLMKFQITGTNLAATAATVITLNFQDATTDIGISYDVLLPAVANVVSGTTTISAWVDLGNGRISALADNVLNINISSAPAGAQGSYRIVAIGTEE